VAPPPGPSSVQPAGSRRRWLPRAARAAEATAIVAALAALGLWWSIPATAQLADRNPSSTAFIDLRRDQAATADKPFALAWQWRPLSAISHYLRAAVIYAEDYNFYRHDGVDWDAIEHAVTADWNKGAMAIGGSTITQQLAKNLYLSPKRSMLRKLREAMIAFSLEDHLTKQRILELYLNVVEWGDGVFGAEAAAHKWFHHSAQSLSPAEAIRLAIALPNPISRAPNVRSADLTKKSVRIVRLLRMQGLLDAAQERTALDELGASSERVLPDREVAALRSQRTAPSSLDTDSPNIDQPATSLPTTPSAIADPSTIDHSTTSPPITDPTVADPSAAEHPTTSPPDTDPSTTNPSDPDPSSAKLPNPN
jgi:monofunctional biosynthetic peptidoglycan transglycosylase